MSILRTNFRNPVKKQSDNVYVFIDRTRTVPKGFIPVYVGEEHKKYVIPLSYLSSIKFKALLSQFEEDNRSPSNLINLSCSIEMFEAMLDAVKTEKNCDDKCDRSLEAKKFQEQQNKQETS